MLLLIFNITISLGLGIVSCFSFTFMFFIFFIICHLLLVATCCHYFPSLPLPVAPSLAPSLLTHSFSHCLSLAVTHSFPLLHSLTFSLPSLSTHSRPPSLSHSPSASFLTSLTYFLTPSLTQSYFQYLPLSLPSVLP